MAFVIVQHLDPDHESILEELLTRHTRLEVHTVEDGVVVRPDHVYVIPPNKDLALLDGKLLLTKPEARRGSRFPIDRFFRSLAEDQGERAVCIVLSGTGTDGTLGLQDRQGQRRHGDGAGAAVGRLRRHAAQRHRHRPGRLRPRPRQDAGAAHRLRRPRARDAAETRAEAADRPGPAASTRCSWCSANGPATTSPATSATPSAAASSDAWPSMQLETVEEYADYLRHDPLEVDALFRELLIGVTTFFRDPEAFDVLTRAVRPLPLLNEQTTERAVARLGARLLDRRGGVLHRHAPAGAPREDRSTARRTGLRDRHRRRGRRAGAARRVPGEHRRRRAAGAACAASSPTRPTPTASARPSGT